MAQRVRIHWLVIGAVVGFLGVSYTVFNSSPYGPGGVNDINPLAVTVFFISLFLALQGGFGLLAYLASFVMFQTAAQRGNVSYASEQGMLVSALIVTLLLLSTQNAIQPITVLILLAIALLWEVFLLVRTVRTRS